MTGTAAELVPVREIDDHAIGDGRARRGHARACRRPSTTRSTDAPSATASGLIRCRSAPAPSARERRP